MSRLKIQSVNMVPPIPTMIIVIPKVQLSILKYLLDVKKIVYRTIPLLEHSSYITSKQEFQQKSDFFNKVT